MPKRICVMSLGGTIAMGASTPTGVVPSLSGRDLIALVPELAELGHIKASPFRMLPGAHLSFDDIVALAREIRSQIEQGADGIVVTQGTDTLEETAFALELLLGDDVPVVVTGAMRNPTLRGADGAVNLVSSVLVASTPDMRHCGVTVVMNEEIHSARYVQKRRTSSLSAFQSDPAGPIGWVSEGVVRLSFRPQLGHKGDPLHPCRPVPSVAVLVATMGDGGEQISGLPELGYQGCVVEGLGGGHVPASWVPKLEGLARQMPVVLSSRTGGGESLRKTYGFTGSETDLLRRGMVSAGDLSGVKARVLLSLILSTAVTSVQAVDLFERATL